VPVARLKLVGCCKCANGAHPYFDSQSPAVPIQKMPLAFFEDFLRKIFKRQLLSTKNRPFGAVLLKRTTAGIFSLLPAPTVAGEWGSG
jgi:hypothetical protein